SLSDAPAETWAKWDDFVKQMFDSPGHDPVWSGTSHALRDSPEVSDARLLRYLCTIVVEALIIFGKTEALRALVTFAYSAYEVHLVRVIQKSNTCEAWLETIAELMPYLLLKSLMPVHDALVHTNPRIGLATHQNTNSYSDPGVVDRVCRLF